MKLSTKLLGGALLSAAIASTSFAASHVDEAAASAITARKSHMQLYQHYLGVLGNMAKGATEYDAEVASAAASDFLALTQLSQRTYWPQGSDGETLGTDVTKASAAAWENFPQVMEISGALVQGATAMSEAAGNGQEALQGAMGGVGQQCGACHRAYRLR